MHQWNEELGVFQCYFETDWVVDGKTADVEFTIENIHFMGDGKQSINYDPYNSNTQSFQIQKDGIGGLTLKSFEQSEDRILLQSAITFTEPEMKSRSWVRIQAVNGRNEPIQEAETSIFGTPGASGEYLSQQVFKSDALRAEGTQFQLTYDRTLGTVEGTWSLNMDLSKKQLENGSFKETLNIPLGEELSGTKVHEMTVTPTQIRLTLAHKKKYTRVPYLDYQLDVGGNLLNGGVWSVPGQSNKTELRFEMTGLDPSSLVNQPVNLIAKHRVDEFAGDDNPIHLSGISDEHQTFTTHIEGYPITWTYYMDDNNLYVESLSSDQTFGGVNQTYYFDGKDRRYGKPAMMGLLGDNNNKHMDVYENFDKNKHRAHFSNMDCVYFHLWEVMFSEMTGFIW
ncbi:hypothetical protein [Cytobacillus depressus]|uniref:hypothetical protein n=1 Tax=Cytobacillus depressus TaxID=1602942 RepID=UPI001FE37CAA|nr:hypothetical protein [Cytobacillus depressus]